MRVARTTAFLDLCGFTAFNAEHGDERATELLAGFRLAARSATERRGLRLVKWLGDGVMISSPESEPLLAGVAEIMFSVAQSGSLPLRAGVCRGKVIMFEGDDYIGSPINMASRMCDKAQPGQILVAGVDSQWVPWFCSSIELEKLDGSLLGQAEEVNVIQIQLEPGPHPLTDPVCGLPLNARRMPQLAQDPSTPIFCSNICRTYWQSEVSGTPL